jgi:membrane protease YdiL (CAAX protease family)
MENFSAILILLLLYATLLFMISWVNKLKPGIASYHKPYLNNLGPLNYLHIGGILIMLLPALIIKQLPVFILSFPDKISISQTIIFLTCFGVIGFFPWKKFNRDPTRSENASSSSAYHIISYALVRCFFLIVYEWFFRGLLLISFCEKFGNNFGIMINVLLYVLIHTHKNKKEMIGCIPVGILLCVFTIWWQSIWPAIIFHLQIAIINEWPPLQQFISPQKQTAI